MFDTLSKAGKYLGQAAKMMIGVPDYDNYVEHMRITHPDQTPMTYEGCRALTSPVNSGWIRPGAGYAR